MDFLHNNTGLWNPMQEVEVELLSTEVKERFLTNDPFAKSIFADNKHFYKQLPLATQRRLARMAKKDPSVGSKYQDPLSVFNTYDVMKVIAPPYDFDSLSKLYERNAAHNAAVTAKATNIVGLGWDIIENPVTQFKIEQVQGEKGSKANYKKLITKLKEEKLSLLKEFDSLNDDEEFGEIMVKIWTDVESIGNGYLEIGRNRDGNIGYLGHVPGLSIRVRAPRDGFIQLGAGNKYVFFRNYGDTDTQDPTVNADPNPNQLIHFKKYTPTSTYYGLPDIIGAMSAVYGDSAAKEYNLEYFENKAVPRYVLITKGVKLAKDSHQRLIDYFQTELKKKHHGTLYLPLPASINQNVDAKFEPIENTPQEQSFMDFIKQSRLEVLMVHRVPPSKVGIYEHTNLAVSRDADKTFKEQVCRPEQRRIEKKINRVFSEFSSRFIIKFQEVDIIDADMKSRMHDRYLRTQVMKPNEVRREIGLPSDPEGDSFLPYQPQGGAKTAPSGSARPPGGSGADATGTRATRGTEQDSGQNPAK